MPRLLTTIAAAVLLGCGSASAQVGGMGISPGTSPLGIASAPPFPGQPGVSPPTSGTSPLGPTAGFIATCGGIGGAIPQASFGVASSSVGTTSGMSFGTGTSSAGTPSSTVFDGGSNANTASGTCPTSGGSSSAGPAASASSPTGMGSVSSSGGRIGIPLGSTELGGGGLSPMPQILAPNPSAPSPTLGTPFNPSAPSSTLGTPCPTTGMSSATAMSSGSC